MLRLPYHVADVHAALYDDRHHSAHGALGRLQQNGVAQVMSYVPCRNYRCHQTFCAVSPQMRLDAEVLMSENVRYVRRSHATVRRHQGQSLLVFTLNCRESVELAEWNLARQTPSFWWAEACHLPLEVQISIYNSDEEWQRLQASLCARVVILRLKLPPPASADTENNKAVEDVDDDDDDDDDEAMEPDDPPPVSPRSGPCQGLLDALPTLTRLATLTVEKEDSVLRVMSGIEFDADVQTHVRRVLAAASSTPIDTLELRNIADWAVVSPFAAWPELRSLMVDRCHLSSLADLPRCCPRLTELRVSYNFDLQTLSPLVSAHHLEVLEAIMCDVQNLECLGGCAALTTLDVSYNEFLRDVSGLRGSRQLQTLKLQSCDLHSVAALVGCPTLTTLDISLNRSLDDLSPLGQLPRLTSLEIEDCALTHVRDLRGCRTLENVNVTNNDDLRSLDGLIGSSTLRTLQAAVCGLLDLDGLGAGCPMLTTVDVSANPYLRSLCGLAGAASLTELNASNCAFEDVEGLASCPALTTLDVSDNDGLTSLEGLAGAPRLHTLRAAHCHLQSLKGLSCCPSLAEVDVSGNKHLDGVAAVATAPALRRLHLRYCTVNDAHLLPPHITVFSN